MVDSSTKVLRCWYFTIESKQPHNDVWIRQVAKRPQTTKPDFFPFSIEQVQKGYRFCLVTDRDRRSISRFDSGVTNRRVFPVDVPASLCIFLWYANERLR